MSEVYHSKVIILGSGPAGYTAAVYAARASLSPTLVTGIEVGGQLSITTDVENYPGFADAIQGPWLMEQMHAQAENVGTSVINDLIIDVDFTDHPFVCKGDRTVTCRLCYNYNRCPGPLVGAGNRTEISRFRGICLRYLRRILLSRKRCSCGWRRQHRR